LCFSGHPANGAQQLPEPQVRRVLRIELADSGGQNIHQGLLETPALPARRGVDFSIGPRDRGALRLFLAAALGADDVGGFFLLPAAPELLRVTLPESFLFHFSIVLSIRIDQARRLAEVRHRYWLVEMPRIAELLYDPAILALSLADRPVRRLDHPKVMTFVFIFGHRHETSPP
jgi:hypothetical protein